jgi:hypothetical protein
MFSGIWLLFLTESANLELYFANISIPFDCEFLVAQSEGAHVILTEVYRASALLPLQTVSFGSWSVRAGLTCSNMGLYQRRNSLQGASLKTAVKRVSSHYAAPLLCFDWAVYIYISILELVMISRQ